MCAENSRKYRPLVIYGPSGAGKSTLLNKLMKDYNEVLGYSISHTTRKPRAHEIDGVHYHFTSEEEMKKDVSEGKFIETATYSNNMYGTSKLAVQNVINQGKICILDIEIQGVKQVKKTDLNPWLLFIQPPSMEELKCRLQTRNTENDEGLNDRLNIAKAEIEFGKAPGNAHKTIINDNLETAYNELKTFIEEHVLKHS